MKANLSLQIETHLDYDSDTVTLTLNDIPRHLLGRLLKTLASDHSRQQIVDGINAQAVAGDLGIDETRRKWTIPEGEW